MYSARAPRCGCRMRTRWPLTSESHDSIVERSSGSVDDQHLLRHRAGGRAARARAFTGTGAWLSRATRAVERPLPSGALAVRAV